MQKEEKPSEAELAPAADAKSNPPEEPFAGNISNYTPLPPNCEEREKRGLLQFDACFEGGDNFGLVVSSNQT